MLTCNRPTSRRRGTRAAPCTRSCCRRHAHLRVPARDDARQDDRRRRPLGVGGDVNSDNRSMSFNDETTPLVVDDELGARMERLFESDMRYSKEITTESHAARPFKEKLLETGFSLVARICRGGGAGWRGVGGWVEPGTGARSVLASDSRTDTPSSLAWIGESRLLPVNRLIPETLDPAVTDATFQTSTSGSRHSPRSPVHPGCRLRQPGHQHLQQQHHRRLKTAGASAPRRSRRTARPCTEPRRLGADAGVPGQTRTCGVKSNVAFDVSSDEGARHPWAVEPLPAAIFSLGKAGALRIVSAAGQIGEPIAGCRRWTPGSRAGCSTWRSSHRSRRTGRSSGATPSRATAATGPRRARRALDDGTRWTMSE